MRFKILAVPLSAIIVFLAVPFAALGQAEDPGQAAVLTAHEESKQFIAEQRLQEGLQSARRAYNLAKTAFGPQDPTTGTLGFNYGRLLIVVGSLNEAASVLEDTLAIYEALHGPDAIELVPTLVLLGELQRDPQQLEMVKRALAIQKKRLPEDELAYAGIAKTTGSYLAMNGNAGALPILDEAKIIYEKEYGEKSKELIPVLMAMGHTHARIGDAGRQKRTYNRAIKIAKAAGDTEKHADLLLLAGVNIMQLSQSSEAESYLDKAYDMYMDQFGPNHLKTATSSLNLARFLLATQRYKKAEQNLLQALAFFSENENYRNYELSTLARLVQVYESLGNRDAATPYCVAIGQVSPWHEDQDYRPIFKTAPEYPQSALNAGQEGYVIVQYTVDEKGFVQSPVVTASAGPESFLRAALDAADGFRYAPRFVDGKPESTPGVRNKFTFSIEN